MSLVRAWLLVGVCVGAASGPVWALSINELRIDQFGSDLDEYFELVGTAGELLDELTFLVIGDGPTGSGTIEAVVSLVGQVIPDDGFFLAAESTFGAPGTVFSGILPDLTTSLNFENSDNVTHVLVNGFFGNLNDDLDFEDDGILDVTPWAMVVDAVGLVRTTDLSMGDEHYYGAALGGEDVGPDGSFVPGHVYRSPDGSGSFVIGEFSLDPNDPTIIIDDTPGGANFSPSGVDGDFDDNGAYECADVDSLVAEIVALTHSSSFDMTGDGMVDHDDLDAWLVEAGEHLNKSHDPILEGDANLDGTVDGMDFLTWNEHKFTDTPAWCAGDFTADGFVDGQDFLLWNENRFLSADGEAVPEPAAVALALLALAMVCRRRVAN